MLILIYFMKFSSKRTFPQAFRRKTNGKMGDYDKRMTFARRISERHEMSSKAASQNFHSFLCTHIKIPCMLFLFPFQRKPVASLQKAQGSSPVSPSKPKKSSIRGRE